jgi:hypothetical protein
MTNKQLLELAIKIYGLNVKFYFHNVNHKMVILVESIDNQLIREVKWMK